MFESICVKRQDDFTGNPIDLGFLAEALLFYQRVHIVAGKDILTFLLRTCGSEVLFEFLQSGMITMTYEENGTGIRTVDKGSPLERHDFITWELPGNALQRVAPDILQQLTGKQGKGRRLAHKYIELIKPVRSTEGASKQTVQDLLDAQYLGTAISALLKHFVPEYVQPSPLIFEIAVTGDTFALHTNLDFETINRFYNSRVPVWQNSLSPTLLLGVVASTHEDMRSASEIAADLAVPPSHSIVARCKLQHLFERRNQSDETIKHFQDFTLGNGRAVAEAVNSGSKSMLDVLRLVQKAEKFKSWLKKQPEDVNLRDQYCTELMSLDWAGKLPTKSMRWAIFTAASTAIGLVASPIVGAAAGVTLSATDVFLVDQIIKGWKPNHFVQGPLSKFIT